MIKILIIIGVLLYTNATPITMLPGQMMLVSRSTTLFQMQDLNTALSDLWDPTATNYLFTATNFAGTSQTWGLML